MDSDGECVLVTGVTGTVGSRLVGKLADRDVGVRAATRTPGRVSLAGADEIVEFDFERPETWGTAFENVDPSLVEFLRHSRSIGRFWGLTLVMAGLYTTARLGLADGVSNDTARALDRTPTDFSTWLDANRDAFESATARGA